tara:strand:- start:230 stop:493 length:264 start_codon:yes stop_codon:yes gene_type:complete
MNGKKRIKVGDLVRIVNKSSYYFTDRDDDPAYQNVTGIVVDVTLDDEPAETLKTSLDYWVRVVFLDNTKATLFHDEVEVVSIKKDAE